MKKSTVLLVFGYLWVGIIFSEPDLNFWTQIPKVLYLNTTWQQKRDELVASLRYNQDHCMEDACGKFN